MAKGSGNKKIWVVVGVAALAALLVAGYMAMRKSESETAGRRLGSAVRGATEDVREGAGKAADSLKEAGKSALESTKEFGRGVKEGWKSGEK